MQERIVILDFGSQYSQLIARRVRELQVYCELLPWDTPAGQVQELLPAGFILSGGPFSVYEEGAPLLPEYVLKAGVPVLGLCYGMQLLTLNLGGQVGAAGQREYGPAQVRTLIPNDLLPEGEFPVWMSHGDRIEALPAGFQALAAAATALAAMADFSRRIFDYSFIRKCITPGGRDLAPLCGRYLRAGRD